MIFNGRFLGARVTGVQRFGREILSAGADFWPSARIFAPQEVAREVPFFAGREVSGVGRRRGTLWEQTELPAACGDDFLINLCAAAPLLRTRQLFVLHDIIYARYPRNYTLAFRTWHRAMSACVMRRAARLATVSQASARELSSYFGVPLGRIDIIPESGEHILREPADPSLLEKFALERDGYILAVGSHAPNKNFAGVVRAMELSPQRAMPFVIAGAGGAIYGAGGGAASDAIELGYVTDGQLRALYEGAACFVYPSFYEGFGLPPLEAMSCGCPVLVSNTTSLPEVCGQAALYCDPSSPADIADKLTLLVSDPVRRAEMRLQGLEHARSLTWARGARALKDILLSAGVQ